MTASDYAQLINSVAGDSLKQAGDLANAYDLAKALGDDVSAADYMGQVKGINIVLGFIEDALGDDDD